MQQLSTRRGFLKSSAFAAGVLALPEAAGARPPAAAGKLASKPPLGWNSFDSYGVYLTEEAAMANVEAMAKRLRPFGYEYFVVDNGWFGEYKLVPGTKYAAEKHASEVNINEYGLYQPSKTYFPRGLQRIIDRAHALGLKLGVHLMRGIPRKAVELNLPIQGTKHRARDVADTNSICQWCHYNYGVDMGKPGAQEFYNSLVSQLAGWGIDFIKADDIVPYPKEILGLADAIAHCGRDIVLSLSPGRTASLQHLPYYRRAAMLRITSDIWDRREDLDKAFAAWKTFQGTAYEGFWPDLDMIPFGQLLLMSPKEFAGKPGEASLAGYGHNRWCQLTKDQQTTFITMRALAASPLFVGGDLPTLDEFSLKLLTNREMLAANQNGVMGTNVHERDDIEVWLTPRKDRPGQGWLGVFNRSQGAKTVALTIADLSLDESAQYEFRDVWNDRAFTLGKDGRSFEIAADGVLFAQFEERG